MNSQRVHRGHLDGPCMASQWIYIECLGKLPRGFLLEQFKDSGGFAMD